METPLFTRWPGRAGEILSAAGLGISAYLTYEHYTGSTTLACPTGPTNGPSIINCLKVTTSPWSMQWGIPVAVLGLAFFLVMLPLQLPRAWRSQRKEVRFGRIGWCGVGLIAVLRLVYFEFHDIRATCEWCTSVHVLTFLLFATTVFGTISTAPYADPTLGRSIPRTSG